MLFINNQTLGVNHCTALPARLVRSRGCRFKITASLLPLTRQQAVDGVAAASASTKPGQDSKHPESYIDPTLKYGLNLVLPQTIRRGLNFDAGYDRWEGLPTMQADYFLPIKGWKDKSIFLSPRISLTGTKRAFRSAGDSAT